MWWGVTRITLKGALPFRGKGWRALVWRRENDAILDVDWGWIGVSAWSEQGVVSKVP